MIFQKRLSNAPKQQLLTWRLLGPPTPNSVGERLSVKTNHDWQIWKCVPRIWWRWFNKKIIFVTMWLVINYSCPARWITRKSEIERSCSAGNYVVVIDCLRGNGKRLQRVDIQVSSVPCIAYTQIPVTVFLRSE